jgi:hypothetical protein
MGGRLDPGRGRDRAGNVKTHKGYPISGLWLPVAATPVIWRR